MQTPKAGCVCICVFVSLFSVEKREYQWTFDSMCYCLLGRADLDD